MHAVVLINEQAGSVVERGPATLAAEIRQAFEAAGHAVEVDCCAPKRMTAAIEKAAARPDVDVVVAGGGDGTLSAAAATLAGGRVALGCLPLGTMNLYCRALGMPTDVDAAVQSLADGRVGNADLGEVNGRLFLHHVSIGLQPSVVESRNKEQYSGKLSKMWATAKTMLRTLRNPSSLDVFLDLREGARRVRVPAIFVTSNPIITDRPGIRQTQSAHRLGVYVCTSVRWDDLVQLGTTLMLSDLVEAHSLDLYELPETTIRRARHAGRGFRASVDGELVRFESPLRIVCRKDALRLLLPAETAAP